MTRLIGLLVILIGLAILMGWKLDSQLLKFAFGNVTMKIETAVSFVVAGAMTFFSEPKGQRGIVWGSASAVALIMSNTYNAYYGYFHRTTFGAEIDAEALTVIPGLGSVATMGTFMLLGLAGLISFHRRRPDWIRYAGYVSMTVGIIAMFGYILEAPVLYFYWPEVSTAMAKHTAVLFAITGFGLSRVR